MIIDMISIILTFPARKRPQMMMSNCCKAQNPQTRKIAKIHEDEKNERRGQMRKNPVLGAM
jgi:hypothetical protein